MKKFKVPTLEEVTPDNRKILESLQSRLGFIPNIYATYALSNNALSRYLNFASGKTSLSSKEKEVVNLIVSQINGCSYCLAAHTAIAKANGFTADEVVEFRRGSSRQPKFNALVKLSQDIVENRGLTTHLYLQEFYNQGYTDENLVDLIILIGEKTITNLLHKVTDIPIDFPEAPQV